MPARSKNISDTVRIATRKALESGKLDRTAVRKVTRVASGMLAGIADSLSHKSPRRPD